MSDPVQCDRCGSTGYRRIGQISPEGWSYACVTHEDTGEVCYLYACSPECRSMTWCLGPGRMSDQDAPTATAHSPSLPRGWTLARPGLAEGPRRFIDGKPCGTAEFAGDLFTLTSVDGREIGAPAEVARAALGVTCASEKVRIAMERIDNAVRLAKAGDLRMGELIALVDMALGSAGIESEG